MNYIVAFVLCMLFCSPPPEGSSSTNKKPDAIIARYHKLYRNCKNREPDASVPCDTVYATLATLYYEKAMSMSAAYGEYFNKRYPVIDSAAVMDDFSARIPEYDTSVTIFEELISTHGVDRLNEKLFMIYITGLFYSGKLTKVQEAISYYYDTYSNGYFNFRLDYMSAGADMRLGNYDACEAMIAEMKRRYGGDGFSEQKEFIEYLGTFLHYYRTLGLKEN